MRKIFFLTLALFTANSNQSQWGPDVRLTNDLYNSLTSFRRCVASSGDTVHVAWFDDRFGLNAIFYNRSLDAGLNWEEEIKLTDGNSEAAYPTIRVSGSVVHIAWCDNRDGLENIEIYYKRSIDGGVNWGEDTRISSYPGLSWHPSIALSGTFVHIVWYDQCDEMWEIFYNRSTDGGITWEESRRLTYDPAGSYLTSIAASGTVLHVTWIDKRDGNSEIYYKRSFDNGISWNQDTRMTYSYVFATLPEIDLSGMTVHLIWRDNRDGNSEIYYKHSLDEGITWGEDQRLTNDYADSDRPSLIVSDSIIHVVWHDQRDGPYQIYYKCSLDGGNSWDEDTRLSQTNFNAQNPSVDFSSDWLHVLWHDQRDGNEEIYCKNKYIESTPIGIKDDLLKQPGQMISIFPNPVSNLLHCRLNDYTNQPTDKNSAKTILVFLDILGKELFRKQIQDPETVIDVTNLKNGVYYLSLLVNDKTQYVTKVVISKN